jgi:hypothetical protein
MTQEQGIALDRYRPELATAETSQSTKSLGRVMLRTRRTLVQPTVSHIHSCRILNAGLSLSEDIQPT